MSNGKLNWEDITSAKELMDNLPGMVGTINALARMLATDTTPGDLFGITVGAEFDTVAENGVMPTIVRSASVFVLLSLLVREGSVPGWDDTVPAPDEDSGVCDDPRCPVHGSVTGDPLEGPLVELFRLLGGE